MGNEQTKHFNEVLTNIERETNGAWVYLPAQEPWGLESICAVLVSEEVPPELEDDPEAGIPSFAKDHHLIQALPVSVVQDIVRNAKRQKPDAPPSLLLDAFLFYYDRDAFMELN